MMATKKGVAKAMASLLVGCVLGGASVSLNPQTAFAESEYTTLAQTYSNAEVNIKNAPSVVCEITDSAVLESVTSAVNNNTARPANVIVKINESCKIVNSADEVLGDFATFFTQTLAGKIIPIVRVETQAAADALVAFLNDSVDILDMAVVSANPALVKRVRTEKPSVRGIVDGSKATDLASLLTASNENLATTIILSGSQATTNNVRYLQARTKTVWVKAENNSQMTLNDCIQSGAYGIISNDFTAIYSLYASYGETFTHMPINVAYQTGKYFHNENSKLGAEKMLEKGADAVHMSARLTKDNEIVFMYDESIERTSNGEGKVKNYTKAELQEFSLDIVEDEKEPIPAFSDVISVFKETNAVLWLELREESVEMFNALATALETHDCYEHVVVLANTTSILEIQSSMPKVSTVLTQMMEVSLKTGETISDEEQREYLKPQYDTKFADLIKNCPQYNANVLLSFNQSNAIAIEQAIKGITQNVVTDRGISCFFNGITRGLSNGDAYDAQTLEGVVGFMGHYAPYYQAKELRVIGKEETRPAVAVGDKVTVKVKSYNGNEVEANAKVFTVEDKGDSFLVVAVYEGKFGLPIYSQSFTIIKGEATQDATGAGNNQSGQNATQNDAEDKDNVNKWLFICIPAVVVLGGAIAVFVIIKKKKNNKDE